jgi:electron transfer flavoprotein beta subunit
LRIAVLVKQALDETEMKSDEQGRPRLEGTPGKVSTFDKNAIEEGLKLKGTQGEVVVFTVGGPDAKKSMKEALAMGADRGVLIDDPSSKDDSLRTAEVLAAAVKKAGGFDLVLAAEGSSDTYSGFVGPMVGETLGLPYVGYARKVEAGLGSLKVERALEDSVEEVEARTPCVVSVVSEINEPRYPTLIQIMQASKKPVEEARGEELVPPGKRGRPRVVSMSVQSSNRKHVMIEGGPDEAAAKLVEVLKKDGVL